MIPNKFLVKCFMGPTKEDFQQKEHLDDMAFYNIYLITSDQRVLQHIRENALGIPTSLSQDEYLELEQSRQFAVEQIRLLATQNE